LFLLSYVVYGEDQSMQTSAGALVSWRRLECIPAWTACQAHDPVSDA
jgi:hypothetical protein